MAREPFNHKGHEGIAKIAKESNLGQFKNLTAD
jgi:hypothetical protein